MTSERDNDTVRLGLESRSPSNVEHALSYAHRGWPVLPLHYVRGDRCSCENGKACASPGKHPIAGLAPNGVKNATTDETIIRSWWQKRPKANIGVATGPNSGIFLVEIDVHDGVDGFETLAELEAKFGALPETLTARSGGGGRHYVFTYPAGLIGIQWKKDIRPGVEIRAIESFFFVAPPSVHKSGRRYEWVNSDVVVADPPQWLLELSKKGSDGLEGRKSRQASKLPEVACPSQRHDSIVSIAGTMLSRGLSYEAALEACIAYNSKQCKPPKSEAVVIADVKDIYNRYPAGAQKPEETEGLSSQEREETAHELFKNNRFIELVRESVQKFHVGDWNVTELLLLSVASMSVENTKGIQPKLSGESGMGKTHAVRALLHLMHRNTYRAASFSSKALFYDRTLRSKTVIFSDDVNLAADVEETVRAAMTNWDTPTQHITLDGQRNPVLLSLPPRVIFWLTSVNTKSTIQLLNRQVEVNVDESSEQDKRVEYHQRELAESGLSDFYVDDEVELLREAFLHLNQMSYRVKIPFISNIKFTKVRNRRNFPIFLDFIKAYCILNYSARCADEDGGLIATKEDFDNAIELFKTVAVQQVTKLNEKERRVALVIRDNSPCDIPTIMDETRLSNSYIFELIHGPHKSDNKGMLEKIPELKFYSKSDIDPDTGSRWGRNHYALPAEWTLVKSYESIVYWEEDNQLRSVSDSFGDGFRNSETTHKGLDSRTGRSSA